MSPNFCLALTEPYIYIICRWSFFGFLLNGEEAIRFCVATSVFLDEFEGFLDFWRVRICNGTCERLIALHWREKKCCLNRPHHNGSLESRWWSYFFLRNDQKFDNYFSNGWFNHQLEVVSCLASFAVQMSSWGGLRLPTICWWLYNTFWMEKTSGRTIRLKNIKNFKQRSYKS